MEQRLSRHYLDLGHHHGLSYSNRPDPRISRGRHREVTWPLLCRFGIHRWVLVRPGHHARICAHCAVVVR